MQVIRVEAVIDVDVSCGAYCSDHCRYLIDIAGCGCGLFGVRLKRKGCVTYRCAECKRARRIR